ncbi:MAG: type II/IV secretion system protein [Peptococcaceae bacterium]|nr:type II/IV secretion system protein [Peptococcaceae bacterium]
MMQHTVYHIDDKQMNQNTAAGVINQLLQDALQQRASDIHLEPDEQGLVVRFRCDGQLTLHGKLSMELQQLILNRLKVMAELDITEKRLPQDGHLAVQFQGQRYDLRISSLPLYQGEKLVLRILGQREQMLTLEQLGFSPQNLQKVQTLLQMPGGMILVCGPTGSGKTTTLYSMLAALKNRGQNIVTLEDPVEYEMPGINQVQINERTGLTFAKGLRSILRQDPDIIMVGEIRDLESAEIAIRLAYTGHLVLASLHTGDALGAVKRMVEMGIASHLLASCLNGVIAQRLVRCSLDDSQPGRIAIQEVFLCDRTVKQQMSCYERFLEQQDQIAAGFESLAEDGRRKAEEGKTGMAELFAVLGPEL